AQDICFNCDFKKGKQVNIKLSAAVLAASLSGASVVWADIVPSVEVEAQYNDNIYASEDSVALGTKQVESWVYVVRPGVDAVFESGANTYNVGASLEQGLYETSKNGSDDYLDSSLYGSAMFEFDASNHLEAGVEFNSAHDERGSGSTVGAGLTNRHPDKYDELNAGVKYTLGSKDAMGRMEVSLDHMDKDYKNNTAITRFLDRDHNEIRLAGYFQVMPKTSVFVEGRHKEIEYDNLPAAGKAFSKDSDEDRYFVGVEWEATAKTTGTVRLGRQDKDFDGSSLKDYDSAAWEVELVWQPRSYSTFYLAAQRGTDESSSSATFIDAKTYTFNWDHDWSERVSSSMFYVYTDEEYGAQPLIPLVKRDDKTDMFGGSVNYQMSEDLKLYTSYRYEDKDSSRKTAVGAKPLDYDRNVLTFGLSYAFK
ncbi:MAG: outer membrane beta-barrel protein, partial [Pseudomonadales bacterium]|nr:outer membrane beta-barrel protein [Pseudomonadales bacterium]